MPTALQSCLLRHQSGLLFSDIIQNFICLFAHFFLFLSQFHSVSHLYFFLFSLHFLSSVSPLPSFFFLFLLWTSIFRPSSPYFPNIFCIALICYPQSPQRLFFNFLSDFWVCSFIGPLEWGPRKVFFLQSEVLFLGGNKNYPLWGCVANFSFSILTCFFYTCCLFLP